MKPKEPIPLSDTKLKILKYLSDGFIPKEIAVFMKISPYTVDDHLRKAREVMKCKTTLQLVTTAYRNGWLNTISYPNP